MKLFGKLKGPLILLLTTIVWGAAFVAQTSAADSVRPFTFNFSRAILASLMLLAVIGVRQLIRCKKSAAGEAAQGEGEKTEKVPLKRSLLAGALCGIALCVATNVQQFGIASYPPEVAASGRSGFLTSTYVIFIAVFCWIVSRKFNLKTLISTVVCVGGMYMLCLMGGIGHLYLGDLLVLVCAVTFAAHILITDKFKDCDGLIISCVQFGVCGVISFFCMLIFEGVHFDSILSAWLPILYSGLLSSGMGYTLQIVGQKYTKPQAASIILSMESVFAAVFGWIILSERLGVFEIIGCVLVFASVILSQLPDRLFAFRKRASAQPELPEAAEQAEPVEETKPPEPSE